MAKLVLASFVDAVSEAMRVTSSAPGTSEHSEAVQARKLVQRKHVRETLAKRHR